MRAFLSHQTKDKVVAGNLRAFVEKVGIQSFLAHEDRDLRPAQPFADEMRSFAFGWFASLLGQHEGTVAEFLPAPTLSQESKALSKETSFVCKLRAISAAQRARHSELAARLADAVSERQELVDGYALRVAAEKIDLAAATEWITLERRCCPFLRFQLEAEPDDGPVWLRLTGASGVKEFLRSELSR